MTQSTQSTIDKAPPAIEGVPAYASAAALTKDCDARIADVRARLAALERYDGTPTVDSVLKPANFMWLEMVNAWQIIGLLQQVHPDEAIRDAADACDQEFAKLSTDINLSRPLYERIAAVDVCAADQATQYSHMKTVRDFRRAGVDKDERARAKIRKLHEELNKLSQDFSRTTRDDVREIVLESAADLAGLPEDYIAARRPGADGKIHITTDYPDYVPFMSYAKSDALRKELRRLSRSRGYPANEATLESILQKRYELARLLGYADYAAYITEDKMVTSPQRAGSFIDEIADVVNGPAARDKAVLLARLREIDPSATDVGVWQYDYLSELIRKERYSIDAKALRTYFQFINVKDGIFRLTEDLFGVTIKEWKTPVWHDSVTAHEVWEDGKLIGRFYLDLFPRTGKYKHAAQFPIAAGIEGEQIPIGALVCNLPGAEDPHALMEFDDVVTVLHEFGHLLHHEFAGHGDWVNNSGVATEWDFVEAPSQLLENWAYDYDTLKRFAVNAKGEPIPEKLVKELNRARFFGLGLDTATQTFYAALSLGYYDKDPAGFELFPEMLRIERKYDPFPYLEGTHFYTNFGHLDGYSAMYYTYQWSLAISYDLLSRFETAGMRNREVSLAYRKAILDPGGSRPAEELVNGFLGRPWSTGAYRDWLNRTE